MTPKVGDRIRSKVSNSIGICADVTASTVKIEFGPVFIAFVPLADFDKYYALEPAS